MEKAAEAITYQGVSLWMIPVAFIVGIAFCAAFAQVWKVVEIHRGEKDRKRQKVEKIAQDAVDAKVNSLADNISEKVMESMKGKFDAIDRKLDADKRRIEAAEKRSSEHDKALERIETTLEKVDQNIQDMSEGLTCMTRGTVASLNHQLHNGNKEELEEAAREMNRYLTHRPIVPVTAPKKEG